MKKILRYSVKTRYGTVEEHSSKKAAIASAKAEQRDGWPSWVREWKTGKIIWGK